MGVRVSLGDDILAECTREVGGVFENPDVATGLCSRFHHTVAKATPLGPEAALGLSQHIEEVVQRCPPDASNTVSIEELEAPHRRGANPKATLGTSH